MPSFLSAIDSAMVHAISNEIYFPLSELSFNQQRLKYATLGLEIYYGHWAHNNENELVGNSEYIYNNRNTLEDGDPLLYAIIDGFFEENLSCKAHLNQSFSDTFRLNFDTNFTYTNKSQYINNVNLSGTEGSSIFANHNDNSLLGNSGDNTFFGYGGDDSINGDSGIDKVLYQGTLSEYIIVPMGEEVDSIFRVIDLVNNRDGMDHLIEIEEVVFDNEVFNIYDLLELKVKNLPDEFVFNHPYPNPFNPVVNITFSLPNSGMILIEIFDLNGKLVKTVTKKIFKPGNYSLNWDAKDNFGTSVSSGVYLLKFEGDNNYQKRHKIIYLK